MNNNKPCSLIRRLACILYDSLLLFSILFVASFLVLPFTAGEAVASTNQIYPALLLLASYGYFVWQWTRGGQTLGMRAWRCQVQAQHQVNISMREASLRFVLAIFSWLILGLGFLIAWFRRDKKTLHDLGSGTRLVIIEYDKD